MSPYPKAGDVVPLRPVPVTGRAARIAQELRISQPGLAAEDEVGAADVTATILDALGETFDRQVPSISADKQPRYRRKQLAGERALSLFEFVWICRYQPEASTPAVRALLDAIRPAMPVKPVAEEAAEAIAAAGTASEAMVRHLADGRIDFEEALELRPMVAELGHQVAEWLEALDGLITREADRR